MPFKDYALRGYDENSGILESDWYNAQVELLRLSSETWGSGLIQIEEGDFSLMRWYEYTLTLEPGQTLKNAVTAPLYPAIDAGYTPNLYSYTYLPVSYTHLDVYKRQVYSPHQWRDTAALSLRFSMSAPAPV